MGQKLRLTNVLQNTKGRVPNSFVSIGGSI